MIFLHRMSANVAQWVLYVIKNRDIIIMGYKIRQMIVNHFTSFVFLMNEHGGEV